MNDDLLIQNVISILGNEKILAKLDDRSKQILETALQRYIENRVVGYVAITHENRNYTPEEMAAAYGALENIDSSIDPESVFHGL